MAKKIVSDNIVLIAVNPENMEQYLYVKKMASLFTSLYEEIDGLWSSVEEEIKKSVFDDSLRMLIYSNEEEELLGYIGAEKDNDNTIGINIGVLEKYRNQGIATEAASVFIDCVFNVMNIDFVTWKAFVTNKSSCRVAEKIGGVKKGISSFDVETMLRTGISTDNLNGNDLLQEVQYVISKK